MLKTSLKLTALLIVGGTFAVAPHIEAKPKKSAKANKSKRTVRGRASYNQRTPRMVTAARVPRGSKLWVWHAHKSEASGFAVMVNDSGPYSSGRVLDLSTGAFKRLYGGLNRGVGPVCYRVIS